MGMAIAGSVFCGFAYGSQALLVAVASEILPRRYRTVAQSGLNMANGLGAVFGLLVGSRLVARYHQGFRIFYYITAGILALSALTCLILYNPPPRPIQALSQREKLRNVCEFPSKVICPSDG
jgi:MFS family permease